MNFEALLKKGGPIAVLAAVTAIAIAPSGGAAASSTAGTSAAGCTPAKNVEAIIDDSGSMSSEDPLKFRTQLLSAFANISTNNGVIFGGGEFGSNYNPLFGPATIPAVNTQMQQSFIQVDADNGGTNFDLAFSGGLSHNATADARIFLTDGLASPPNAHKSPPTKTYVIGLGDIVTDPQAQLVLSNIAADTGGPAPALVNDASQVQPVAGAITALVNCKPLPLTFSRTFNRQGETAKYGFKPTSKSADILISWGSELAALDAIQITQAGGKGGKKSVSLASIAKKGKKGKKGGTKVKVVKKRGTTFVTLKLKKLKKGKKIKFKVKAKRLSGPTLVTTQVIR